MQRWADYLDQLIRRHRMAQKYHSRANDREKKLKDWLVEVLYPTEFRAGGPQRTRRQYLLGSIMHEANRLAPSKNA